MQHEGTEGCSLSWDARASTDSDENRLASRLLRGGDICRCLIPDQEPAAQQASSSAAPEKAPLLPASAPASGAGRSCSGASSGSAAPGSGPSQQQQQSSAKQRAYQAPQVPFSLHACSHTVLLHVHA